MELLTCKICGKQLPNLALHIHHTHKMKGKEYKEKYGVDRLVTREQAQKMALTSNKNWNVPKTRENRTKGIIDSYTPELKKERSKTTIEQFKDPEQRILRQNSSKNFSPEHKEKLRIGASKPKSLLHKIKLSNTLSSQFKNEWKNVRNLVYDRADSKCEVCGVSETELISNGKPKLRVHEKNYNQIIPKIEDCVLCCQPCHSKQHKFVRDNIHQRISHAVINLLRVLKVDTNSDNFKETPRRFASVLTEFSGIDNDLELELEDMCNAVFEYDNDSMVFATNIETSGLCPHHLLPVLYKVSLAYIPQGYAIGVSKLARICDVLAKQLLLQESYTHRIADALTKYLKTPSVLVYTEGSHTCMRIRGVKSNASIIVSEIRGDFRKSAALRAEAMSIIKKST